MKSVFSIKILTVSAMFFFGLNNLFGQIATISVDKTGVCKGGTSPIVTFDVPTGSPVDSVYTYYYTQNGVSGSVSSTLGATKATMPLSTSTAMVIGVVLDSISYGDIPTTQMNKSITVTIYDYPNANFTFDNSTPCAGDIIQFTDVQGDATNHTFAWDFGDGVTSTEQNPTHAFFPIGTSGTQDYTVSLVVTNNVSGCTSNYFTTVTVKRGADADLNTSTSNVSKSTYEGYTAFSTCGDTNTSSQITFTNGSTTTSTNTFYTIDWGDGTAGFSANSWTSIAHTYSQGLYTLKYTVSTNSGCSVTKKYKIFVGANPAVTLGNPGNTKICSGTTLTFPIYDTGNNPPATTYTVIYNDGSPNEVYSQTSLPSSISHTFNETSCGTTSVGTLTYENSFSVTLLARNPCGDSYGSVMPIYVTSPPKIILPATKETTCVNTQMSLTYNTDSLITQAASTGCTGASTVWSISPNTNYTLNGSSLGSDNSSNDYTAWTSGSQVLTPTFTQPGTYIVTLKAGNRCSTTLLSDTICVSAKPVPTFTVDNTIGCAPFTINTTNTTDESQNCGSAYNYTWYVVGYAQGACGTTKNFSMTDADNSTRTVNNNALNAKNVSMTFKNPGIYTIRMLARNSCSSVNSPNIDITVTAPPKATINPIATTCQTSPATIITPSAVVTNCGTGSLTYEWSFPGGSPSTSTNALPGDISYASPGTYTVGLKVTGECGTTTATDRSFTINPTPQMTNMPADQVKCAGQQSDLVTFTSNVTGTTFSWTNSNTAIGLPASGTGNINPFTLTNTGSTAIAATITVTPTLNGCSGTPETFTITVNPSYYFTTQPQSSTVCLNGVPATLEVKYTNGVGTPQYQWYSNTTNSNTGGTAITGATASTYVPPTGAIGTIYYYCTLTLIPDVGCGAITSQPAGVTVTPLPTVDTQPLPTQTICVGGVINALTATYKDGTGTPTYQWYRNTTNSNIGGIPISGATSASYTPPAFSTVGSYYFYVVTTYPTTACGVVISDAAEVIVVSDPVVDTQPVSTQTICQGTTPTTLSVTVSGGIGTYKYQWYRNTANSPVGGTIISGAVNSTYDPPTSTVGTLYYYCVITQTGGIGCNATSTTSEVVVTPGPTITTQPKSTTVCIGDTPNTLEVVYANGVGAVQYEWYSNTVNSTTAGTPTLVANTATYVPPTNVVNTTYYFCVLTFSSGGCGSIISDVATVTVTPFPSIKDNPLATQTICVGGIIDPLTVTLKDGVGTPTYQWYNSGTINSNSGGAPIAGAISANYTPPAFNTFGTYYYYVVATYTGTCGIVTSNTAEIVVVSDPVVDVQPLPSQTVCQNSGSTQLTVHAQGGIGTYLYQWYRNTTNSSAGGTIITGATNSTYTPLTTTVGTTYYYCLITQTGVGCDVTSDVAAVIVNKGPTITQQPQSNNYCLGENAADLKIVYSNGVGVPTYQWYSNTVNDITTAISIPGAKSDTYTPDVSAVGTTYYFCIVTFSSGGCSNVISNAAVILVKPVPVISDYVRSIGSGATFTVTPADNPPTEIVPSGTTYTWGVPVVSPAGAISGASASVSAQSSISQTLVNDLGSVATVTYSVIPEANGCKGEAFKIEVTVNPRVETTVDVHNITCYGANNGALDLYVVGGDGNYLISWTGPMGYTSSLQNISGLAPGTYTLHVQDSQGMTFDGTYTITEPSALNLVTDSVSSISCHGANDGSIHMSVSGGTPPYIYSWNKDGNPFSINEDLTNLSSGYYELRVTDQNGCGPETASFTISEPDSITVNLLNINNIFCYGDSTGSISVEVTGGTPINGSYIYEWTGPNGFTANTKNLADVKGGTYYLTVTDANGCTKSVSYEITQPNEIIIDVATTPVTCYGDNNATISINVSGGVAPYTIVWDDFYHGTYLTNLAPGTYTVTVTDANSCRVVKHIVINETQFTIHPVIKNISCNGEHDGSIALNIIGGVPPVTLVWNDDPNAGAVRNNLGAGTYSFTLSDANCSFTQSYIIVEPAVLNVTAHITDALDCDSTKSGAINLLVSGGTEPYSFIWSNGATTKNLSNVGEGNYAVTITDAGSCTYTNSYKIYRPAPLNVIVNTTLKLDCNTGKLSMICQAAVTSGIPSYTYSWNNGDVISNNGDTMEATQSGIYILTVTDSRGCIATYTFDVQLPKTGFNYQLEDCNDKKFDFNGYIPNGTAADYTFQWNFGDGQSSTEQNVSHTYANAGLYTVAYTMTNDTCTVTYTRQVEVYALPVLSLDKEPIICEDGGSVTLKVSGASTYKWFDGSVTDTITISTAGDYYVMGMNENGCSAIYSFTVKYFDANNYQIYTDVNEISSASPTVKFWSDDIAGSEYHWDFGDGSSDYGLNLKHTYKVDGDGYFDVNLSVMTPHGCMETATKRIWILGVDLKNTFSPNNDGVDDVYLKGWQIKIYNRNGILMYEGKDGWDGTYQGKPVTSDTYFVVLYYDTASGKKTKTGYITVIR